MISFVLIKKKYTAWLLYRGWTVGSQKECPQLRRPNVQVRDGDSEQAVVGAEGGNRVTFILEIK